jgi:outer membrane lipoprotein-sorting protein
VKQFYTFLLLLLLAACARPDKPVWTELPSVEALLQQLAETTGRVDSLDAAASVNLTVQGKFFSSQQFLLLEKPDRLRADVLTGFGQLILQLASDGQELSVSTNTTVPGRFYRGPATTENLVRFTRIPLATRDMLRLLLYDPPLIDYRQSEILPAGDGLLLKLDGPELRQELRFNPQLQLVACRYYSEGQEILEVLYQKIDKERIFPETIRLTVAAENTKAAIKFSELQLNVEIPAERFRVKKPDNVAVEVLP